ncbi:MAG: hypothetical protein HQM10_12625 [Candidatus Riflebacteria bacterium]|nr:hypothetical protein [Candidatus Riflebacteria bacterium]
MNRKLISILVLVVVMVSTASVSVAQTTRGKSSSFVVTIRAYEIKMGFEEGRDKKSYPAIKRISGEVLSLSPAAQSEDSMGADPAILRYIKANAKEIDLLPGYGVGEFLFQGDLFPFAGVNKLGNIFHRKWDSVKIKATIEAIKDPENGYVLWVKHVSSVEAEKDGKIIPTPRGIVNK